MSEFFPAATLETHIGILGKTGSGKSNLAKVIVEGLLDRGQRVCVIDPTGTWWGLRLRRDGTKASNYGAVILGGRHADLPIAAGHGVLVAETVAVAATPVIIDTRTMTVADRTRFFTGFAETLIQVNRGPLTLVIDEAHLFMPQGGAKVGGGAPAMLHAGNNLVSLGRGAGLRIILISQRPAKLHKDSLTQVETLVAMRLIAPQDRRAINDWIGEWASPEKGKDVIASLPSLKTGDAWLWAPELGILDRKHCPLARTFDTGHLRSQKAPDLHPIDLDAIASQLKDATEKAQSNDPRVLRNRITALEKQLAAAQQSSGPSEQDLTLAKKAAVAAAAAEWRRALDPAITALGDLSDSLAEVDADPPPPIVRAAAPVASPPRRVPESLNGEAMPGRLQKILDAVAWWNAARVPKPSRIQVAFMAGQSPRSGAFANYLGELRTRGLVGYPAKGEVELTDDGHRHAQPPAAMATTDELHNAVLGRLPPRLDKILRALIGNYPDAMTRQDLAKTVGQSPTSGAFANYLGELRGLKAVDYPGAGQVRAVDALFLD